MDIVYFSNEFPTGDLTATLRQLRNNSKSSNHNVLSQLMLRATQAIKQEIQELPTQLRLLFPTFESLFNWVEDAQLRTGTLSGAVEGALLILVQLALYINHIENDSAHKHSTTKPQLCALGVGLLSGAAVSMSSTLQEIPQYGTDAIILAFRMGVHVRSISTQLESQDTSGKPDSWAYVVHDVEPEKARAELDIVHASTTAPNTNKIFISAISETSVTVSGPPSRLKNLFQKSKLFRDSISIALPVYGGLCHAPHIYGLQDIDAIIGNAATPLHAQRQNDRPFKPTNDLYSTSSGDCYYADSQINLFELVVAELLTKAIEWSKVIASLVGYAKTHSITGLRLQSFGNSTPLHDLKEALQSSVENADIESTSFLLSLQDSSSRCSDPRDTKQAKLAIVGMSCRLPGGATNTEKFWEILENGMDVSREVPTDRFDIDTHFDAEGKDMNKTMTRYGCFLDDPSLFDAAFFNMSPREALAVDPQMRLMLVTAYEALEQSGFVGNRTMSTKLDRIGTYFGQACDDYREVNQGQEVSTYYIPGGCRAFGPGRINYFFKFAGPSYSVDTACSSGLAAIELACQALWNGNIDMAVTGGVNVLTNPDGFTGLNKGHFLTTGHNACKTWDATADGYCRADGVGSLVIKRLEDAHADNDNVLGLILAAGTNHSANAVSITHPHAGHQADLSKQVIRQAGINPLDVSYIELHGTGTQAGDYEEMQGVLDVYAPVSIPRRRPDQSLHIGSVKANIGHGESVAGTSALIKVLLMLQKSQIPRHIGIKTEINPRFPKDFEKRNVHIPMSQTPWLPTTRSRIAAVNNFGAAGGNTMMIVEESPQRTTSVTEDTRAAHTVVISAKTKTALAENTHNLIEYLTNHHETTNLSDLGYTTTARRYQHSYRVAVTASSIDDAVSKLLTQSNTLDSLKPVSKAGSNAPSVAFTFTGQGSSYRSMGLELYRDAPIFRRYIQHLDMLAQAQGFPSFLFTIDGTGPEQDESSAVITQLALLCLEMALAHYWQSLGVTPDVVIGHSLGEYAAMKVAGVISASDAIFMVGRRAEMLQSVCAPNTYCMVAVRASLLDIAETAQGQTYTVACINSPRDTVLSGSVEDMDKVTLVLEAAGFRCFKLKVPYAFHSEQTDPILKDFESLCNSGVVFHEPKMPIISPLLGKVVFDNRTFNAEYVRRATREAVDFVSALENAEGISIDSDTIWIEIGPHPVCTGLIHHTLSSQILAMPSMRRGEDNWKTMAETMGLLYLAGVGVDWNEFHKPFENQLRLLDLPKYAWDEKKYWIRYKGDWCLTKGNTYYDDRLNVPASHTVSEPISSLVHTIIEKSIDGIQGSIVMQSNLMQKDFLAAANGHRMNDCAVVTSSIHADIAYTLGKLLYKEFYPNSPCADMDITNIVVEHALIAHKGSTNTPQIVQVTAQTTDIHSGVIHLTWQNVKSDLTAAEPFVNADIIYGNAANWLATWAPAAHLVQHRIEMLQELAAKGEASRLTKNVAYGLFARHLVDYSDAYRGMQSVVMSGLEGFADIALSTRHDSATWTVPPHFIDSVAHLAGFIMNCSDAIDTQANYCVTSGWGSMRFAVPLVAGSKYRSYVKMMPTKEDALAFLGDVFILNPDDGAIVGMVQGIRFRCFPRVLLQRFFTAPEPSTSFPPSTKPAHVLSDRPSATPITLRNAGAPGLEVPLDNGKPIGKAHAKPGKYSETVSEAFNSKGKLEPPPSPPLTSSSSDKTNGVLTPPSTSKGIADRALALVARETALDISELVDDADFTSLGIDSLMSLVLAEKFRIELDVHVNGSLFLDYPTIRDLRVWLVDYYG